MFAVEGVKKSRCRFRTFIGGARWLSFARSVTNPFGQQIYYGWAVLLSEIIVYSVSLG